MQFLGKQFLAAELGVWQTDLLAWKWDEIGYCALMWKWRPNHWLILSRN